MNILNFYLSYKNNSLEIYPVFEYFAHVPPINNSYYISENFIITYQNLELKIIKNRRIVRQNLEKIYCNEFARINKTEIIAIKKFIWLLNDKTNRAGDNGEYFFRYLINKNPFDIEYFFVIKKNCSDFIRLRELDHILVYGSKEHNFTFINADKIISSSSDRWEINPFGSDRKYLIDLFHFDFIFFQHGITKDDLSKYLNRFIANFSLIIAASIYEYKSFLSNDYAYSQKKIKLTGFSRFDNLNIGLLGKKYEKTIIIIPTWRMNIKATITGSTSKSIYSDTFKYTDFFKFYNNLINSPRLLETMDKFNYKGIFCLHPLYSKQLIDFKNNSIFNINHISDYQKLLIKSSLLITDYSSIFFEFSYMKKPIICAQFDNEKYINLQYQKGYFDYRVNGIGPICTDLENCIDKIIEVIKKGCKIENK